MYLGAPFKVNHKYAEKIGEKWVLLSAKYGFIEPDFVISENYSVTFNDPATNHILFISSQVRTWMVTNNILQ